MGLLQGNLVENGYRPSLLHRLFILNNSRSWRGQKLIFEAMRYLKQAPAPLARTPAQKSARAWTALVKEFALAHEADAVGITPLRPEWVFDGKDLHGRNLVMLGLHPDYEVFSTVPATEGALETLRTYNRGHRSAMATVGFIRSQGYEAYGFGAPFASGLSVVPAAIAAGLGELGKHGSIINRKYGSAFRLAYVPPVSG